MATGADYEVVDVGSGEEITNPGVNDVMVAFHKSTGALEKIDYNKLAKAIIEQYTGSTIGGSAQSVKTALDNTSIVNVIYTDSQVSGLGGVDGAMKDLITSKKVPADRAFVGMLQASSRYTMVGYVYPNYDFGCILFFNFGKVMKLLTASSGNITISALFQ